MHFFVLMELHEKCMISIFPYMKIVWLAFLVNPGNSMLLSIVIKSYLKKITKKVSAQNHFQLTKKALVSVLLKTEKLF